MCLKSSYRQRLQILSSKIDAYSPTKKLSQGYAYVEGKNGVINSINCLSKDDEIDIYLVDGKAKAVITEVYINE